LTSGTSPACCTVAWADASETIRQQVDEFLDTDDPPDYEIDEYEEDDGQE
jgi:hypothetical protein